MQPVLAEIMKLDAALRALNPADPHRYAAGYRSITDRIAELTNLVRPVREPKKEIPMATPIKRRFDRKRPIAQRIIMDRADQEIALIIDRYVRGATVESRALAHAAILRALVDASTH